MKLGFAIFGFFWLVGPAWAEPKVDRLIKSALAQVGVTLGYDPTYRRLAYPGGDVPQETGVCTDVIVRAYRAGLGVDLQVLVHEDMKRSFASYPKIWGLGRPDRNIDHRRVPNLATFFTRHGEKLAVSRQAADYRPGDIVTWRLQSGVPHIGLVSNEKTRAGEPLIIHNIGQGSRHESCLFDFEITGRFSYGLR